MDKLTKTSLSTAATSFLASCVTLGFLIYDPQWIRFFTFLAVGSVSSMVAYAIAAGGAGEAKISKMESDITLLSQSRREFETRIRDLESSVSKISLGRLR